MFEFLVLLGYDFGAKIKTYVSEKEQGTIEGKEIGDNDFKTIGDGHDLLIYIVCITLS